MKPCMSLSPEDKRPGYENIVEFKTMNFVASLAHSTIRSTNLIYIISSDPSSVQDVARLIQTGCLLDVCFSQGEVGKIN